ncbi:hypothetical protein AAFF_G00393590 [Aldrovandia affinis]|uniref:Uncharacterized protein n=1 Tax=Aldrovandia affinis TaxID=143900 RepID=A0AAD7WL11_9TELE|nr:hypothetical protein AAFF_G00393590 [Aldrovandia affinis]
MGLTTPVTQRRGSFREGEPSPRSPRFAPPAGRRRSAPGRPRGTSHGGTFRGRFKRDRRVAREPDGDKPAVKENLEQCLKSSLISPFGECARKEKYMRL